MDIASIFIMSVRHDCHTTFCRKKEIHNIKEIYFDSKDLEMVSNNDEDKIVQQPKQKCHSIIRFK
jgi:hypothetical protein